MLTTPHIIIRPSVGDSLHILNSQTSKNSDENADTNSSNTENLPTTPGISHPTNILLPLFLAVPDDLDHESCDPSTPTSPRGNIYSSCNGRVHGLTSVPRFILNRRTPNTSVFSYLCSHDASLNVAATPATSSITYSKPAPIFPTL